MERSKDILEITLTMYGAQEYMSDFKRYGIDSSVLPVLEEDDLQTIGIHDKNLRNKLLKHWANLQCYSDERLDLTLNSKNVMNVLQDIDLHILLLNASLSYALNHYRIYRSDIKLSNVAECLLYSTECCQKELCSFHSSFFTKRRKLFPKWKLMCLTLISCSTSLYILKKYLV